MSDRPKLTSTLDSAVFSEYYYLKEELVAFCRENGLPVSGGKAELSQRIVRFLDTGRVPEDLPVPAKSRGAIPDVITEDTLIEENIVCSEVHRAFFRSRLGKSFTFQVAFQQWLRENPGKRYGDALEAYKRLKAEKKQHKTVIGGQFEYNTYIRDFFEANKGRSLQDAICCWRYKKALPGNNRYEPADLIALESLEKT